MSMTHIHDTHHILSIDTRFVEYQSHFVVSEGLAWSKAVEKRLSDKKVGNLLLGFLYYNLIIHILRRQA